MTIGGNFHPKWLSEGVNFRSSDNLDEIVQKLGTRKTIYPGASCPS